MSSPVNFGIVVPVGPGGEARLRYTLRSIAAQAPEVKVALCDASGAQAVQDLADDFQDIIVYRRHGPDNGQSNAINEGWRVLDTDILGWLNADDYLAPGALTHICQVLEAHPQAGAVYGQSLILETDRRIIGLHPAVCSDITRLPRDNIISQPSCFLRRETLEQFGFVREDLHYTMDWELWVRLYKDGVRFRYTPRVLSSVLWETGTKTSTFSMRRFSEIAAIAYANNSPFTASKTVAGFLLHHLTEYTNFGARANTWLREQFSRLRPAGLPWRPDREQGDIEMALYHYFDQPSNQSVLTFAKECGVDATLGNTSAHCDQGLSCRLSGAVPPGSLTWLKVAGDGARNLTAIEL